MNREEIVIYVFATTNEMRECFKTYEHLFDKYSKINCYGILKNGLKIQFTNEIRGLRKIKTYDEIKIYLQEMNNQQENQELKERINKAIEYIESNDVEVLKYHDIPSETTSYEIVTVDLLKILRGENNE